MAPPLQEGYQSAAPCAALCECDSADDCYLANNKSAGTSILVFPRSELLELWKNKVSEIHNIPSDLRRKHRGCRARKNLKARARAKKQQRQRYKPPISSVLMGNVNALTRPG